MHDIPRQKLSELLAKHGPDLCDDTRRLEGLLKDVLRNEYRRETNVLVSALREGVVHELRASTSGMPLAALAAKLTRQMCDNLALDEAAACWSVESWALALGIEITQPNVVPTVQVPKTKATGPTPKTSNPSVGVDLAAIALQHREAARRDQEKAADVEAIASQIAREAKANAVPVEKEAKRLAEQTRDFAAAAQMLEKIDPRWRDAKLYETICLDRDRVAELDANIQNAVLKGRLSFLRSRVSALLKLQPKRDDMRRLLEVLPDEPELAKEFTNSIGMKFVLVEPGEFMMGSNEANNEKPPHLVEITQPFYLGVYPVTQAEYQAVMGTNPSHFKGNARLPVEQVSWDDAVVCAQKLSQLSAEQAHGLTYRLPSEAEWEYACGAGSTGKWCFGNNESLLGEYAWFDKNSEKRSHPVGEKKPNAWGLHDMHGNVWEWCQDYYDANAYKKHSDITQHPHVVESGSSRVLRGGSWDIHAANCRSAFRVSGPPFRFNFMGFRLALSSVK